MTVTQILGIGMTPVGEHWDKSLRALAAEAAQEALANAGSPQIDAIYIANAYGSTFNQQSQLGALIADHIGLRGTEAFTIEAGDAAGGAAIRMAHLAVCSGLIRTALVIGVEKVTDIVGSARVRGRNISLDADYEAFQGATLASMAGLLMRRYMYEHNLELSAFEGFSINAHANGQRNAYAMYRNRLRVGAFANAPMIADPVSLFDSAPDGDGAAALVISSSNSQQGNGIARVVIAGSAAATDAFMLQEREKPLWLEAVARSTRDAMSQARISHADVDLFEVHDAFTILATLSLESAGFAEPGQGWRMASENLIALNGHLPISTMGGLKSRGNPAGASGVYQACEAVLQLRNQAGDNQVPGARTAMIQNLGGLASTAVTHVLRLD